MKKIKDLYKKILKLNINFIYDTVAIFIAIIIFMVVSQLNFEEIREEFIKSSTNLNLIITVSIAVITILLALIIRFLNTDKEKKFKELNSLLALKKLNREIVLRKELKYILSKEIDSTNSEKAVYEKVIKSIEDSLISKFDERFRKSFEKEYIQNTMIDRLLPLTKNTEKYIDRIQRNSIVNLVIGIVGTIISIFILTFSLLSNKIYIGIDIFLMHFLPRVTFVIFIQLFAFFFLKLYKSNLEDAKYFQNELTNLEAKSAALKIAYLTQNNDVFTDVLKNLSVTERNFKIGKSDTDIEKMEKNFDIKILTALKSLMNNHTEK